MLGQQEPLEPKLEKQFVVLLEKTRISCIKYAGCTRTMPILTMICSKRSQYNYLKRTLNLEEKLNLVPGCIGLPWIQRLHYTESQKRIRTQDFDSVMFKVASADYDNTVEEQLKLMYAAVRQLNDIDKALVFLYLEDKPYSEISETLGITEVNARVKMNRVKKKLKELLNS